MQANRKVLETDEWLRVTGCEDVFAIGDCASIHQRRIMVFLKPLMYLTSELYAQPGSTSF